ncbi:MAG TPA: hypothetical protein DIT67_05325 [Octadecabacter sp.]|nr:hypothetical protein [Octadecabacter sp.]
MADLPKTLREKLTVDSPQMSIEKDSWTAHVWYLLANALVLTGLTVLPLVWAQNQSLGSWLGPAFLGLIALWAFIAWIGPRPSKRRSETVTSASEHFLLSHDRHGFMGALDLDAKTVLFDGSNLYHFGVDHGLGAQPVRLIAQQLRSEGYRIVCFFDANIFYTLIENGAYPAGYHHELNTLLEIFGLKADETYIVPSGVQADKYIMSSLKHLPKSFAVSNDQFRDYAKTYGDQMQGSLWRKGVSIKGNEIRLKQHRFKQPLRVKGTA